MQYPIHHPGPIVQYDERVFIWLDETGDFGGAEPTLEDAQRCQGEYAHYLMEGPEWIRPVPNDEDGGHIVAAYVIIAAVFVGGMICGAWWF